MAAAFAECTEPARLYGACVKRHMEGVERGACEKEFNALNRCFRTALASRKKA
jgi:hypothetical protein